MSKISLPRQGGGLYADTSEQDVNIRHTILAQNTSSGNGAPDIGVATGRTASVLFSLIGDNTGSGLSAASVISSSTGGNLIGDPYAGGVIDSRLGPLADNGGPTHTHLPLATSPVVDAGDPAVLSGVDGAPGFDQRGDGTFRVVDGTGSGVPRIDIGAVELNPVLTGDFNGDGGVDAADYSIWRDTRGSTTDLRADTNGNAVVDDVDYSYWKQNFGRTIAIDAHVAEAAVAVSSALVQPTTTLAIAVIDEPVVTAVDQEQTPGQVQRNDSAFAVLGEQPFGAGASELSQSGAENSSPAASLLLLSVNQDQPSVLEADPWDVDQEGDGDENRTALLTALAVEDLFGGIDT